MKFHLVFFSFFFPTVLFSAGPMLHLWAAERFCAIYGITDQEMVQQILIGTEFPDIRYLTQIPREMTHPIIQSIQEVVQSPTLFQAGMKLHAWVDCVREDYVAKHVYEAVFPYDEGHSATLLKFIEEEILADFYDGRRWSCYFDEIHPEELAFASRGTIIKWHTMIQWSMCMRPSWLLWGQSYRGPAFGVAADTLYNWCYLLPELKQQAIFKNHLQGLLDYIERALILD